MYVSIGGRLGKGGILALLQAEYRFFASRFHGRGRHREASLGEAGLSLIVQKVQGGDVTPGPGCETFCLGDAADPTG